MSFSPGSSDRTVTWGRGEIEPNPTKQGFRRPKHGFAARNAGSGSLSPMRLLVAAALLLLTALPAAAQGFVGAMSGSWWDPSRGGEGQYIAFETVGGRNVAYLAYFTYNAEGRATW